MKGGVVHNKLVLFFLFFDIPNEKSQVEKYQWKNEKVEKMPSKAFPLTFIFTFIDLFI